jgi:glycosyltransferase involved in cell wall biosynthesis
MVTVIITVFNNTKYLKESIDSVIKSVSNFDFEILVGIDSCSLTLSYVKSELQNYDNRLKFYFFEKNVGTYIVRNSLVLESNYDNIIFFDSDDIMKPEMVTNVLNHLSVFDVVKPMYEMFHGDFNYSFLHKNDKTNKHSPGVFGIRKKVFLNTNGFEPWICAADSEFFWRIGKSEHKIKYSDKLDFFHRRHSENLTTNKKTSINSDIRKSYHKKTQEKKDKNQYGPLQSLSINAFYQINDSFDLSIIIPTYNNVEFLKECLDSILISVGNYSCEILVGIDNCKKTLKYVEENINNPIVKFYFFDENVGPYIVKNSLSQITSSKNILFFDSDDVMENDMITETIRILNERELLKPMYLDFKKNYTETKVEFSKTYGEGVFGIKKSLFEKLNGFEPWRCAADSDFMARAYKSGAKVGFSRRVIFFRRIHENSLTQHPETNYSSKLRGEYDKLSRNKKNIILEKLETSKFYRIYNQKSENVIINGQFINQKNKITELFIDSIKLSPNQEKTQINYDRINEIIEKRGVYNPQTSVKPVRENPPKNRNKLIEIKKGSIADMSKKMMGKPDRKKSDFPNIFSQKRKRF